MVWQVCDIHTHVHNRGWSLGKRERLIEAFSGARESGKKREPGAGAPVVDTQQGGDTSVTSELLRGGHFKAFQL